MLCYTVHMSTGYRSTIQRFAKLAQMGEVLFHAGDLANLWKIENKNTLHTTLKRYSKKKLLFRIYKGFYSLKPINEIDPWLLGIKALHQFAYISTETVLAKEGIIQQNIASVTMISAQSRKFNINKTSYQSRKLSDKYLFNTAGIKINCNGIRVATTERSVADLLYFNPNYYFDAQELIDWKKVQNIQKEIGYKINNK